MAKVTLLTGQLYLGLGLGLVKVSPLAIAAHLVFFHHHFVVVVVVFLFCFVIDWWVGCCYCCCLPHQHHGESPSQFDALQWCVS